MISLSLALRTLAPILPETPCRSTLAPVLLIVVAIAGVVFGADAVRGNLVKELSGVFGQQGVN